VVDVNTQIRAAERLLRIKKAPTEYFTFAQLLKPDPNDPGDATKSTFLDRPFPRALAKAMEDIANGKRKRLIVNVPPRHGKTELTSRMFIPWFMGKNPNKHVIFTGYSDVFAQDIGRDVRSNMRNPAFKQVFPHCTLEQGSEAAARLRTTFGGMMYFVGAGGAITGRGGDLVIVDDPIKNSEEANSVATREKLWTWFNNDVMSRFMTDEAAILLIQTRWHEDDIPGRLTDPTNPCYNEEEAKLWQVINMPALAEAADDPLGRKTGEPLFPERQSLELLLSAKRRDPVAFSALYQQRPSPPDGAFFKADMLRTYASRDELPSSLRIYAASDHAVATKQHNDRTCMIVAGVDEADRIWLLDAFLDRKPVDFVVEKMIDWMRMYKPLTWFADQDHIAKSISPFLKKRMRETGVYCHIDESKGYPDKVVKAQPILGRMSMGMVYFPSFAPWWADARDELLKFPRARHDDFVDTLSSIGRGLDKLLSGKKTEAPKPEVQVGTMRWIKEESKRREAATFGLGTGDGW
jgi:predicted phage terminase large subunit-like protein